MIDLESDQSQSASSVLNPVLKNIMPALKNPKYELFAQAIVSGLSQECAYHKAGFKPHRANAARMRARRDVSDRINDLVTRSAARAQFSATRRLAILAQIAEDTLEAKAYEACIAAIREANRMEGVYPRDHALAQGEDALSLLLRRVIDSRPALPIRSHDGAEDAEAISEMSPLLRAG